MKLGIHRSMVTVVAFLAVSAIARAQAVPGVGYDPGARGLHISGYKLDSVASPYTYYTMDLSADPGTVGTHPNVYFFDLTDPAVRAAFELRYGPETVGPRMKAFVGPNNEVRFVVADGLRWWLANHPDQLGGSTVGRNGEPTEREITDVQATGDRVIWQAYMIAESPGYSPENREIINDPSLPPGDGQRLNTFWNMMTYYHNTYVGYYPFSPQTPVSPTP